MVDVLCPRSWMSNFNAFDVVLNDQYFSKDFGTIELDPGFETYRADDFGT